MSKRMTSGMYSSERPDWETPPEIYDPLDAEFHFTLDVCASPQTAKCDRYFTPDDDGLSRGWSGVCWMNPPYGSEIRSWVSKAYFYADEGCATVVCLVPARTDTAWWHDYCAKADEIRFLRGRVRFLLDGERLQSAPFPSAVVIFRKHETKGAK